MRRHLFLLLTAVVAGACGSNVSAPGITSGNVSIPGQYNLIVLANVLGYDAVQVPATITAQQGYQLDVTVGSLTLNSDFTYHTSISFKQTKGGATTTPTWTESGKYSVTGSSSITFTPSKGDSYYGTAQPTTTGKLVIETFASLPVGFLLIPGQEQFPVGYQTAFVK